MLFSILIHYSNKILRTLSARSLIFHTLIFNSKGGNIMSKDKMFRSIENHLKKIIRRFRKILHLCFYSFVLALLSPEESVQDKSTGGGNISFQLPSLNRISSSGVLSRKG